MIDNRRQRTIRRLLFAGTLVAGLSASSALGIGATPRAHAMPAQARASLANGCNLSPGLNGRVQHVMYFQFDNTHLSRDLPNVPSDLEQMPNLLNYLKARGSVITHHHTPLISHTSQDVLTSLTGLYPSHMGVAMGQNSYEYFSPTGSPHNFSTAFTYWTDLIGNGTYNMLSGPVTQSNPHGTNAPAPWVPFTRAGCAVGGVASANQVLENNKVSSAFGGADIGTVFGVNSPEAQESPALRTTDFVGIGVHCPSTAQTTSVCSNNGTAAPDNLPNEAGGYSGTYTGTRTTGSCSGYCGLFGAKYVDPIIGTNATGHPVLDESNNHNPITDPHGNFGFPGFDGMSAANSLGYSAAMQEAGIPVTFAYITDTHDLAGAPVHTALGPGEAAYVAQLHNYDVAFGNFFTDLANHGINSSNTLFVFTSDEGDHFTGAPPTNVNSCNGITVACTYVKSTSDPNYNANQYPQGPPFGEVAVGMSGLVGAVDASTAIRSLTFSMGNDTAPGLYLGGQPTRTASITRQFEHDVALARIVDQLKGLGTQAVYDYLADPVAMSIEHMVTADPFRTPTFTLFGKPDLYFTATCSGGFDVFPPTQQFPANPYTCTPIVQEEPAFAWLHGNVQSDITTTWLGMVGPGIRIKGFDNTTWSDHTDIRTTMLTLLGLHDDYQHDGRALVEDILPQNIPRASLTHLPTFVELAETYKQLNAPVGQFGLDTLQASTTAIVSSGNGDATYNSVEGQLQSLGSQRNTLALQISAALENAEFNNQPLIERRAREMINDGRHLLTQMHDLAND